MYGGCLAYLLLFVVPNSSLLGGTIPGDLDDAVTLL